jgi:diaminohydroxyphosphoribosylaminopyrimidine deaminase/5-amino-6-(5-phosphoribosylamino)uracil reductase
MVGALLYTNGQIIAEGFHSYYGEPHAEVNCINSLKNKSLLKDATLYISLEPCNFQGKTPPCTELILKSGITKVVVGSVDFNPKVRFQGIDYLRSQEIEVTNLNWDKRQQELNIRFFINQTQNEPYFIGKMAMSSDGFIGRKGERVKITEPEIDVLSHKIRAEVEAIIVGKTTWETDSPSLNARLYYSEFQPDIIVLQHGEKGKEFTSDGRTIHFLDIDDPEILKKKIYGLGYKSLLVEGGGDVFRFFMENGLFHEIKLIENQNLVLQTGIKAPLLDTIQYSLTTQKNYLNHLISKYYKNDLFSS